MSFDDDKYKDDAWLEYFNLQERYTENFELRDDLSVSAQAHKRVVILEVQGSHRYTNIHTAREYAEMILSACEYVEQENPGWASNYSEVKEEHWDMWL